MALTVLTAINRVLSRLNEGETPIVTPPDVEALIPDALKRFALALAADPNNRELLRKDFSIAVTSGTGSFATSQTAAEPLLIESLPTAYLNITNGTTPMQMLPDRTQLTLTRPLNFFIYWCNDEGTLRTRNTNGSLTSLNTTVTVTANYVPLISSVPVQLENDFIDVLERMVREKFATPQSQGAI